MEVRARVARAWSVWEGSTLTLLPDPALAEKHAERDYAIAFSRIENHYFANNGFLAEDQLIRDAGRLRGIPAVIVQGRYDMAPPPVTAIGRASCRERVCNSV